MRDPRYLTLLHSGELEERAQKAERMLASCRVCPHACDINRVGGERGVCGAAALPAVTSHTLHFGEEPALSGSRGSGTIFFGNCNLRCVFCQNYEISQRPSAMQNKEVECERVADMMLELQQLGAHNINFVSPSHMVPQVLISLLSAARRGLRLPLVYNSNGYDSLDSLRLLDGVIDIYLPDLKYGMDEPGITYSGIVKYAETAQTALREMHRQVGLLQTDSEGIARKGLIIRHLVMPRNISRTYEVLKFIAEELSPETAVSIMAQYYPANRAKDFPEIDRPLTADEYDGVYEIAESLGLVNGWFQSQESERVYRPDFQRRQVFSREELKE